jgi:hypothetical protein
MQWAVARATENAVFEAAMISSSKFEHFVVGTHTLKHSCQRANQVKLRPENPKGAAFMATAGLHGNSWAQLMKQKLRTPGYTTNSENIPFGLYFARLHSRRGFRLGLSIKIQC